MRQVQLDEVFALLSAVENGEDGATEAIARLERSPQWAWVAMDPESKLLLATDVGDRTLAMAQCLVHHVTQVLAPDRTPLFLTDGFREYLTALLTHYGSWVQPPRRQAKGPLPKPRWMPLPQLLYAQMVKTVQRRLVRVRHRVVFGTLEAVQQVLAACGWQINTSFVERLNLSIRQYVAAIGRRVTTLCKDEVCPRGGQAGCTRSGNLEGRLHDWLFAHMQRAWERFITISRIAQVHGRIFTRADILVPGGNKSVQRCMTFTNDV